MLTTRTARLTTGLLGLALVTAACGGSSKASTPSAGGSAVKIMLIAPTGTQEANYPEMVASAKAAVTAVNARKGFGGHKVELEYCNEKNDPAAAEACGRQAVADHVIAVVGMFSRVGGIMPQLEKAGIASVNGLGVAKDELLSPNSFFTSASLLVFAGCPAVLADAGATSLGMARFDVEASAVTETFAQAGAVASAGKPLALSVKVPPTNADYAPVAAQLEGKGVKGVTLSLTEQASVAFIQAAGSKVSYCHVDAGVSEANLKALGAPADNFYVGSSYHTLHETNVPAIAQFTKEMDAAAKTDPDAAASLRKGSSLFSWGAVQILEKVLAGETGDITAATVLADLKKQTSLDVGFTLAPIDWSKDGPVPGLGRLVNLEIQGEKWDAAKGYLVPTGKTYNIAEILGKAAAASKKK
jgi:ABC-type branched-subunit amino acid transport system substrate-binding protein